MPMKQVTTLTAESIERFRSSLYAKGRSQSTVKAYTTDLKVLLDELEVDELERDEYEECGMNWLTANRNKVQPKTTGRRLTSLRAFAKWAKWGDMFSDYSAPTALKGDPHPLPEGVEGVRRMLAVSVDDRHAALIALCGLCGLRISEALSVRASDFNMETMTLKVRGKGDKERIVPISPEAWNVIAVPVVRAYVSIGSNSGDVYDPPIVGLKDRYARSVVTRTAARAGLRRKVASHDLRATFATEVYNKTQDQRLVQMLLGHSSGTTTEVYIGRSFEQMREGVRL